MKLANVTALASAVGIALVGAGMSSSLEASSPGSDLVAQAGQTDSATGRYIITFSEQGLVAYKGDVAGLARTAPDDRLVMSGASRKFDANSSAARAYKAFLESKRAEHITAIEQALGRPLSIQYTYDVTRNAISAAMSPAEAAMVARLDGVTSVAPVMSKRVNTFRGPTFIGADTIWSGASVPGGAGTRGQGVKVGVIDTGTNIGHPSFTDDASCGFTAANPKLFPRDCNSNNGTICTGTNPNAFDGQGHGVHTSSTAAGNTIDNTVTPAPLLPDGVSMSGVAPCASLYTYKVANSSGGITDDAITAAIQNAIVDQVDVVNFSIGPTCGGGNPWADSLDFLEAEAADVFVAASAGNTRASCTDPTGLVANNGPWMLTVAASTQDQIAAPVLSATGPGTPPAATQNIALIAGNTTLQVDDTEDFDGMALRTYPTNIDGCSATGTFPAGYFNNAVAIIQRGNCNFSEKITNAYNAGARVVIITNNQPGAINMDTTGSPTDVAAFSTYKGPGDALIAFVNANLGPIPLADQVFADGFDGPAGAVGQYRKIAIGQVPGDILAKFSFRGPTQAPYDNLTKPDITGPGVNIYAAFDTASGSYGLDSGTSMSSPHLAGAAALVRAAHPDWTPMEVKSALQTTAKLEGLKDDEVTPWNVDDVGSGRVDLSKAALAGLTLDETAANFEAANPNGGTIDQTQLNLASLRQVRCNGTCSWTRTFKNRLGTTGNWSLSATNPTGYTMSFSPSSFTLAPGATQTVTVTATGTSANIAFGEVTLHEAANQSPDQHLTVAVKGAVPTISVTPTSLTQSQAADTTTTLPLTVANTGGGTLTWNVSATGVGSVWNQPKNSTGGIVSDYSTSDNGGGFTAADFTVSGASTAITKITTFGFDNTNALLSQPTISWRIYSDAPGMPSGNPDTGAGTPVWQFDTAPTGAGVTIAGSGDITLDLAAAGQTLNLPAGTYWLSVFPTYTGPIGPAGSSRWNWSQALLQGGPGMLTGNLFGVANWTALQGLVGWPDVAFNLQGTINCGAPWLSLAPTSGSAAGGTSNPVTVTFNSTGLAAGTYTANACFASNDVAHPITMVPVTLTVTSGGSTCSPTQLFGDPSLENGGAPWTGTDSVFGSPFCDSTCDDSGTVTAHTGEGFVWFGGTTTAGTGSLSQAVVFPSGQPRWLNYWFINQLGGATGTNATFTIKIDGNTVGTVAPGAVSSAYEPMTLEIPAQYLDGNSHTVRFDYAKTGTALRGAMIDDITLDCSAQSTSAPARPVGPVSAALRSMH